MPRPRKCRRVCAMPQRKSFAPTGTSVETAKEITMTVDEYETIRLIDLEGLNQEECAQNMDVARTTAQAIYNNARKKLACFLVDGGTLQIEGGEYALCDETQKGCHHSHCRRRQGTCPKK